MLAPGETETGRKLTDPPLPGERAPPVSSSPLRTRRRLALAIVIVIVLSAVVWTVYDETVRNRNRLQLHLALTGDPTEMVITWITPEDISSSMVEYGLLAGDYSLSVDGENHLLTGESWPGLEETIRVHEVILTDLIPGTTYHYRARGDVWSGDYEFTTPPAIPLNFTFGVVGDQTPSTDAEAITESMIDQDLDLVLMPGDVSYAEGDIGIWQDWFRMIEPHAARVPHMVCAGNHDSQDDFFSYLNLFRI